MQERIEMLSGQKDEPSSYAPCSVPRGAREPDLGGSGRRLPTVAHPELRQDPSRFSFGGPAVVVQNGDRVCFEADKILIYDVEMTEVRAPVLVSPLRP